MLMTKANGEWYKCVPCDNADMVVIPVLDFLKRLLLRLDCSNCEAYVAFAAHTDHNLRFAATLPHQSSEVMRLIREAIGEEHVQRPAEA